MGQCCNGSQDVVEQNTTQPVNQDKPVQNNIEQKEDKPVQKVTEPHIGMTNENILQTLSEINILSSLKPEEREKLASQLITKTFKENENLMTQGDVGDEFFIIASGKCKVLVINDNQKEVEIATLETGDYCGEQALLKDAKRTATIKASSKEVTCLILNQKIFKDITSSNNIQFAKRDAKRLAISAELIEQAKAEDLKNRTENNINIDNKSDELILWLLECVKDNILFSHLESNQKKIVIKQMYKENIKNEEYLIKEGSEGSTFYVIESGEFKITVNDVGEVDKLQRGRCVGELALLYNAPRAANVIACTDCVVWTVNRQAFRKALMEEKIKESNKNIQFLKKCELLKPLLSSELNLIDSALEPFEYKKGDTIFNLGDAGDKFYIVKEGILDGIAKDNTKFEINVGGFFGERALLTNEPRAATIKCKTNCILLTLTKEDFDTLLGPLEDIMKRNMEEYEKPEDKRNILNDKGNNNNNKENNDSNNKDSNGNNINNKLNCECKLEEFKVIGILGRGAFGTVKLVIDPQTDISYALKGIRKCQVVELGQQAHILNEKKVMNMLNNQFLVNLCGTYKDEYRVYFLLEVCLGGELFTILRKMRSFDENTAKFYSSCVVEAFEYMHNKNIIYRDLKPENLVLTKNGYLKVTDFGFAKVVPNKTFTLCGTPDYLAPEIVTGQGHGKGVDWWTIGILIYEMLASFPPFFDDEPMMTYRKIIQGKYKFPRYLSPQSKDLITKFLKPKPTKRLGVIKGGTKLIKSHPWFKEFKWDLLIKQKLKAPIRPKIKSQYDLSNFDHFQEKKEDITYKGNPDLGWDKDF